MTEQQRLREAAARLGALAWDLNYEIDELVRDYPPDPDMWEGPNADTFYLEADLDIPDAPPQSRADIQRRVHDFVAELRAYASGLESHAHELDQQPEE